MNKYLASAFIVALAILGGCQTPDQKIAHSFFAKYDTIQLRRGFWTGCWVTFEDMYYSEDLEDIEYYVLIKCPASKDDRRGISENAIKQMWLLNPNS